MNNLKTVGLVASPVLGLFGISKYLGGENALPFHNNPNTAQNDALVQPPAPAVALVKEKEAFKFKIRGSNMVQYECGDPSNNKLIKHLLGSDLPKVTEVI